MNPQETERPERSEAIESTLSIGSDNTHLSCADVLGRGDWKRMEGKEIRWNWSGSPHLPLAQLLDLELKTHRFPSVSGSGQSIHLCKLNDGGIISYELESGLWLHTLNTASSFRLKVFELNLVPLESLRYFLTGNELTGNETVSFESVDDFESVDSARADS